MPLASHIVDRFSAQRIVSLTNPDDPGATTSNATRLANAAADVQAEFEIWAGVVYDDTDNRHIEVGVECMMLKLRSFHENEDPDALRDKRKALLEDLGKVTGRNRPMPATDGVLEPSEEPGLSPHRPDFDRSRFEQFTPDPPGAAQSPRE